jgi:MraZ protein
LETTNHSDWIVYNSEFRYTVDEKRRIAIPAVWRPSHNDVQFTLVIWPKHKEGICLRVLPERKLAELMDTISKMPNTDPNKGILKRYIGSKSALVALDKSGRVILPDAMTKAAGITDQVVLVGLLDLFEIWSPERYQSVEASDSHMATEAFRMME